MDTPISVRVSLQGVTRKFKIPLGDLNAQVLPAKVRSFLAPNTRYQLFASLFRASINDIKLVCGLDESFLTTL
jgi:hypothetical protein